MQNLWDSSIENFSDFLKLFFLHILIKQLLSLFKFYLNLFIYLFFPGLDVMPFPTTPSTKGKRAGQELKSGTSKSP